MNDISILNEITNLNRKIDLLTKNLVVEQEKILFSTWLEFWLRTYKLKKCKPTTLKILYAYSNKICVNFGNIYISQITSVMIQEYLNSISRSNTKNKIYIFLKDTFKKAVNLNYLSYNPVLSVEIKNHKSKTKRAYFYEEQDLIIKFLPKKYKPLFIFLCCTGLRIGEFLALEFPKDIDFIHSKIKVNKTANLWNRKEKFEPKSETSNREILFVKSLFNEIEKYIVLKDFFTIYTYSATKKVFYKALKELNITDMFIHNTRHTFASICYQCKIPEKNIQELLGHSKLAITQDIYTHLIKSGNNFIFKYICELGVSIKQIYG